MAKIKIRAEKIEVMHLSPGDMFVQEWNSDDKNEYFAADVKLRLSGPLPPESKDKTAYKLTVTGNARHKTKEIAFRMDPHIPPGFKEEI